jgi:hypothetical protein
MSRGDGYMHTAWIPCATLLGLEIEVCPDLPLKLAVSILLYGWPTALPPTVPPGIARPLIARIL